jgi:hypothetical protein
VPDQGGDHRYWRSVAVSLIAWSPAAAQLGGTTRRPSKQPVAGSSPARRASPGSTNCLVKHSDPVRQVTSPTPACGAGPLCADARSCFSQGRQDKSVSWRATSTRLILVSPQPRSSFLILPGRAVPAPCHRARGAGARRGRADRCAHPGARAATARHSAVNVLLRHVRCPTIQKRSNHRLPKSYRG